MIVFNDYDCADKLDRVRSRNQQITTHRSRTVARVEAIEKDLVLVRSESSPRNGTYLDNALFVATCWNIACLGAFSRFDSKQHVIKFAEPQSRILRPSPVAGPEACRATGPPIAIRS